ncbi:MAG: hypothetical protein L0K86_25030 [Actinomycetia bacterium]|nr:hypothetical protein [Actinomycetes bacterium]
MKLSWPWALAIAAVTGVLAAIGATYLVTSLASPQNTSAADVEPGDRLTAAIKGLERDSFYVAPELRDRLTDRQFAAIAESVRSSDEPFYLAYMTDTTTAGYYQNYNAADIIADHIGEDGLYAIVDERLSAEETGRGVDFAYIDADNLRGRVPVALKHYAKAVATTSHGPEPEPSDDWGGPGGGAAAGAMFGAGGFGVLMLILWAASTQRKPE